MELADESTQNTQVGWCLTSKINDTPPASLGGCHSLNSRVVVLAFFKDVLEMSLLSPDKFLRDMTEHEREGADPEEHQEYSYEPPDDSNGVNVPIPCCGDCCYRPPYGVKERVKIRVSLVFALEEDKA